MIQNHCKLWVVEIDCGGKLLVIQNHCKLGGGGGGLWMIENHCKLWREMFIASNIWNGEEW